MEKLAALLTKGAVVVFSERGWLCKEANWLAAAAAFETETQSQYFIGVAIYFKPIIYNSAI